jgi:ribonucleoside-diphosphate reductase alpha chain
MSQTQSFFVIKRDGSREPVRFDAISNRIFILSKGLCIDPILVAQQVISILPQEIKTSDIDLMTAKLCNNLSVNHIDYLILAKKLLVSDLHKSTSESFYDTMGELYNNGGRLSDDYFKLVLKHSEVLQKVIDYERDYLFDFFGLSTLKSKYLLGYTDPDSSKNDYVIERPQHLWMRVALFIHGDDIENVIRTYDYLSLLKMTHATPTLYNAGIKNGQLASCFLTQMKEDSIDGIFDTLKDCAKISQNAGGIGVAIQDVRCKGSIIRGTGGRSNGIGPMCRVFQEVSVYVDQGGGKRKGSFAMYIEPWHADIIEFLNLKRKDANSDVGAPKLFYGLWINDLFMEAVRDNGDWYLMNPDVCKGLSSTYGDKFKTLYESYIENNMFVEKIKARKIWRAMLSSQKETSQPYVCFKDSVNAKSNQQNLGVIKSSNLCSEIMEYTSPDEISVCNLASISLKACVEDGKFNFKTLYDIAYQLTINLNCVIDKTFYPLSESKYSSLEHRPIGIGVQGLADVFMILRYPFESKEASELNKKISEIMYFAAMTSSCDLAKKYGTYNSYEGSPVSNGIFQFDMWGVVPSECDWKGLKEKVKEHGIRNSLLIALMPTASTSNILGNNECFQPITSNMYVRKTIVGNFILTNEYLMRDLIKLDLWNEGMKKKIIKNKGSIQTIKEIPKELKDLYKTIWEVPLKNQVSMSIDRGPFVCQSQSLNIFMRTVDFTKLGNLIMSGWRRGAKTICYYIHSYSRATTAQFTLGSDCESCSG